MGFYGIYPLVMTNIAMENHHLYPFIVDLSIEHCDFPLLCQSVPEGNKGEMMIKGWECSGS